MQVKMCSCKPSGACFLSIFLKGRGVSTSTVCPCSALHVAFHGLFATFAILPFFLFSSDQSMESCLAVSSKVQCWRAPLCYVLGHGDMLNIGARRFEHAFSK